MNPQLVLLGVVELLVCWMICILVIIGTEIAAIRTAIEKLTKAGSEK